jgi:hypothetical protein
MSVSRKARAALFLFGIVAWQAACNSGPEHDCTKRLKEEIYPGVGQDIAEANLKKCGFKTSIDTAKKTLYGDKRVGNGPVFERTQVVINLDSDDRVLTVSVTTGLIGP